MRVTMEDGGISKLGSSLHHMLIEADEHDQFEVYILFRGEPARLIFDGIEFNENTTHDKKNVQAAIKSAVRNEQQGVVDYLDQLSDRKETSSLGDELSNTQKYASLFIDNSIEATLSPIAINEIAKRSEVFRIELVNHVGEEDLIDMSSFDRPQKNVPCAKELSATTNTPVPTSVDPGPTAGFVSWNVRKIKAPVLWSFENLSGAGVLIAVVDTGVDFNHPDLKERMHTPTGFKYPGFDFSALDNNPMDERGHGTETAGIIAGDGTSGVKTGVAPGAKLLALRVGCTESRFLRAFQFALECGVDIINMSMTWRHYLTPDYVRWRRACDVLLAHNIILVNSAGNIGGSSSDPILGIPNNIGAPANCPPPWLNNGQKEDPGGHSSVIAVGAVDSCDQIQGSSSTGPSEWSTGPYTDYPYEPNSKPPKNGLLKPDICAPGNGARTTRRGFGSNPQILRAYIDGYQTSAAAPHVTGAIALLIESCRKNNKPVVPAKIAEAIEGGAVRIVGQRVKGKKENHYGAGRIDIHKAFKYGVRRGWW